jgi:cytosine deaminase
MSMPDERSKIADMIMEDAASILRLDGYGLEVGKRANLVVLDTETIDEAVGIQPARLYVIKEGKVIYRESRTEIRLY